MLFLFQVMQMGKALSGRGTFIRGSDEVQTGDAGLVPRCSVLCI